MMRSLVPLLLLCVCDVTAFVFSCNEVKEMISSRTSISASNACVSLGDYSVMASFVSEIFIQDATDNAIQWSLVEVAEAGGCVNTTSNLWTITTSRSDEGVEIDCDQEFTVLFGSIDATIVTARGEGHYHYSISAENITVVDPRGGILIDFVCDNKEQMLYFYSGFGDGEEEEMFYMGSAPCHDRFTLWALDTAVTISIPDDGYIRMTHYGTGGYLSIGATAYDMVVMGSGKASNAIQHGEDDKFLWMDSDFGVTFNIDGFYEMDPKVGNNIVFTANCDENPCTTHSVPLNSSSVHLSIDADLLSFDYYTKVGSADYWRDDDSFFFRIISTPLPTEPPTTIAPEKSDTDYSCGCELTNGVAFFASDLWLDIIFLVDVSQSMSSDSARKASLLIQSTINALNVQNGEDTTTIKYSRVGLIAMSDSTQIITDLSTPFNSSINLAPSSAAEADIGNAISTAMDVFAQASTRSARQLIYVISASDSSSTSVKINFSQSKVLQSSPADTFKSTGGVIAVMDLSRSGLSSLLDLASPGYYHLDFRQDFNDELQMLCDANCFCPANQIGFTDASDERETPSRGCYSTQQTVTTYPLAKDHCFSSGSILSTVHDDQKELFLVGVVSQIGAKQPFWIGYEYDGVNWEWIDTNNSSYTAWASGQPNLQQGSCAYAVQTAGFNSAWYSDNCSTDHLFVCERQPCSVNNFCD